MISTIQHDNAPKAESLLSPSPGRCPGLGDKSLKGFNLERPIFIIQLKKHI